MKVVNETSFAVADNSNDGNRAILYGYVSPPGGGGGGPPPPPPVNLTTKSIVSNGTSYCALLTSGRVDCWGYGRHGQLGNGQFYTSGNHGSAKPVAVVSTSGSGTLSGVASLTSTFYGYCALLTSGRVDCWGSGFYGELGNGKFYTPGNYGSAIPVAVVSTSGSGTLSGVASLTGNNNHGNGNGDGYCALLT
ncbi:MAG: hypothetical protein NTY27_03725, partial [Actinobacteria bacterium]|nr:hypothetical protein [Actinomycetota bacterium]